LILLATQITIEIIMKNPDTIELGNLSYQTYYFFDRDQLTVSVTQQVYNAVKKGSIIAKRMNSDSLLFSGSGYRGNIYESTKAAD
jgi:hypothetical protein